MCTVDHVVDRRAVRRLVHFLNRVRKRLARRQPPIGLQRERDHDRHVDFLCRPRDPDGLGRVGQRHGADQIDAGFAQGVDLRCMDQKRFFSRDFAVGGIGIARRTDETVDQDRARFVFVALANGADERDSPRVGFQHIFQGLTKRAGPSRPCTPCRRVEDEAATRLARDRDIAFEIVPKILTAFSRVQKCRGREAGQVVPLVEDHERLKPAI